MTKNVLKFPLYLMPENHRAEMQKSIQEFAKAGAKMLILDFNKNCDEIVITPYNLSDDEAKSHLDELCEIISKTFNISKVQERVI